MLTLCLIAAQTMACSPVIASSRVPSPSEKVVLDKNGKVVIPINDADDITYLGSGLYMLSYWSADPPAFYDIHGNRISYKLPEGSTFVKVLLEPNRQKQPKDAAQGILICFNKNDREGVCDLTGKTLMPAKYRSLGQYIGDSIIVATGENYQDELVVKFDGTVLSEWKHDGGAEDLRAPAMGSTIFTEGRRSVCRGSGSTCALADLTGKVITEFKFALIGSFENGIAAARLLTDDGPISVFIDREGNVVKRFPKDVYVESLCGPNRYTCCTGNDSNVKAALIDREGKIIIPAKYFTLALMAPKYVLAHLASDYDELDIYSADGELLMHCPHQITNSIRKHPENSSDKSVVLSTLEEFLAKQDGATTASYSDKDGKFCTGLANSSGEWIVPPVYSPCTIQHLRPDEVPPAQFAFEIKTENFSKDAWARAANYRHLGRYTLFKLFLKDHDVIGMPANAVKNFLGEPLSISSGALEYGLSSTEDNQVTKLYLHLDDKNRVSAWRYIYTSNGIGHDPRYESPWESRNMTPAEGPDGVVGELVPKYPDGKIMNQR